jgi:hypothetical protein
MGDKVFGHEFWVLGKVRYICLDKYRLARKEKGGDCKLKWEEKMNYLPPDYVDLGYEPNQWINVAADPTLSQSPTFEQWNRPKPCPGEFDFILVDRPYIRRRDPRRRAWFDISLHGTCPVWLCPGCPDEGFLALQILDAHWYKADEQTFDVIRHFCG